jgi:FkbM family methyltransferase
MRWLARISLLVSRPDFRRNPLRAIWRRLLWRLRWKVAPHRPWVLALNGRDHIITPKSGAGALIYYQGCSEPATTAFFCRFLSEGMVFIDVGAHIGEYVILASRLVGLSGEVHAFEPQPLVADLLTRSLKINGIANCVLNRSAALDIDGSVELEIADEPSTAAVRTGSNVAPRARGSKLLVPSVRLDTYWAKAMNGRKVDVIKIDVEGAELFVLEGAQDLLQQNPVLVFEYAEHNMRSFGYEGSTLLAFLERRGYRAFEFHVVDAQPVLIPVDRESHAHLPRTSNLVAATNANWLASRLR